MAGGSYWKHEKDSMCCCQLEDEGSRVAGNAGGLKKLRVASWLAASREQELQSHYHKVLDSSTSLRIKTPVP